MKELKGLKELEELKPIPHFVGDISSTIGFNS